MRTTARSLTAYRPLQTKLDMIHLVKSRINQNTAFAEGIIRRCTSAGDYDFPPASFVFIDTGEKEADNQAAVQTARLLITLNHSDMHQEVRIQNRYYISQLYRQIDYHLNQLRLNSSAEYRELNRIYQLVKNYPVGAESKRMDRAFVETLDRQLEKVLLSVGRQEAGRRHLDILNRSRDQKRGNGGWTGQTNSLSAPFYRMMGLAVQSSRVADYKAIWKRSVARQYSPEARKFLDNLEHMDEGERKSILAILGEEEKELYRKLRRVEAGQWAVFASHMAKRLEKSLVLASQPPVDVDQPFKHELIRLVEQAEEPFQVGRIWELADSDHILKETVREWRSFEAETSLEEKERLKEWIRRMDSRAWERFLTLISSGKNRFQAMGSHEGEMASAAPVQTEAWLSSIQEIHRSTLLEKEFYRQIQQSRQDSSSAHGSLILKNQLLRLIDQTEETEDLERVWGLADTDHILRESAKEWGIHETGNLREKKEQLKEWIGCLDREVWERFLTLFTAKKELEELTEGSYQYSQLAKTAPKGSFTASTPAEQILEREQQAVMEYLHQAKSGEHAIPQIQEELLRIYAEKLFGTGYGILKKEPGAEHSLEDKAREGGSHEAELTSAAPLDPAQIEAWLSSIQEIHQSTLLETEFYRQIQNSRRALLSLETGEWERADETHEEGYVDENHEKHRGRHVPADRIPADSYLTLKNQFFHLIEQTEKTEELEQIWELADTDHILRESAKGWRSHETGDLREEKEQLKEWIGYLDREVWERFVTLFTVKRDLEELTERSYQFSQMEKTARKEGFAGQPSIERVLEREQQAVMEYLHQVKSGEHAMTQIREEMLGVFTERLFGKADGMASEALALVQTETWLSSIQEIHQSTLLETEFYHQIQKSRRNSSALEKGRGEEAGGAFEGDGKKHRDSHTPPGMNPPDSYLAFKNQFLHLIDQTEEAEDLERVWGLVETDHILRESAKEWSIHETGDLRKKKELLKEWVGYLDREVWERFMALFTAKKELEELTEGSYQYIQLAKTAPKGSFTTHPPVEQMLEREQQAVMEYLHPVKSGEHPVPQIREELLQIFAEKLFGTGYGLFKKKPGAGRGMQTRPEDGHAPPDSYLTFKNQLFHLIGQTEEAEDLDQIWEKKEFHVLENLSYEEKSLLYRQLDVQNLFPEEGPDSAYQNGIAVQAGLLEREQKAESEIFLVQMLQKSLYETEADRIREHKILWNSTVTALYQDEVLAQKASDWQIPEWDGWETLNPAVSKEFVSGGGGRQEGETERNQEAAYEHRLLRLLKQMTGPELAHLYELQKTVLAAQTVNRMLAAIKSDSLSYSKRSELWNTIADAVYHHPHLNKEMERAQKVRQLEYTAAEIPLKHHDGGEGTGRSMGRETVYLRAVDQGQRETSAGKVLALLKDMLEGAASGSVRGDVAVKPVSDIKTIRESQWIQKETLEGRFLIRRWMPEQILRVEEESQKGLEYGPVSLVPGNPGGQAAPGTVRTPQIPADIETRIEKTVKEQVKDIDFISRKDSTVSVSREYETRIKTLSDQMAMQRQEIEEIKTESAKVMQNADARKITNMVMRRLQDQLRAERLRKGL